jgi:hypothetical protein
LLIAGGAHRGKDLKTISSMADGNIDTTGAEKIRHSSIIFNRLQISPLSYSYSQKIVSTLLIFPLNTISASVINGAVK